MTEQCAKYNGLGIFAFLDILGFSDAILQDWPAAQSSLLQIKAAEGVQTPGITFAIENDPQPTAHLPVVKTFSDAFMLHLPLDPDANQLNKVTAFDSMVTNIGFAWRAAVKAGFVVRGAIEAGQIYWTEADVVGPATVCAVRLEKAAESARIIIGPQLLKLLATTHEPLYGDGWLDHCVVCEDGRIALSAARFIAREEGIARVEAIQAKAPDAKTRAKYDELLRQIRGRDKLRVPSRDDLLRAASHF